MNQSDLHFLVLGAGSVGKRHMQNFTGLGCRVSAMDPREDRLQEARDTAGAEKVFTGLDAIDDWSAFDGVIIGSPPSFHVDQAIAALERHKPVLMEKPLAPDLADALRLADYQEQHPAAPPVLLGYTYRWWPPLSDFRRKLLEGELGRVLHCRFLMSAHLADWHPWEPYQDFFMSSRELGGGALLDESHFIDLMYWFFGMPESILARVEKLSTLDISTDDNVDIVAVYPDNLRVTIHLDLFGRPHEKLIRASGESRSLEWSFDPNRIRYSDSMGDEWREQLFEFGRNDMFVAVAREFIDVVRGEGSPGCSIADGINVMRIIESCRDSSNLGKTMRVLQS
jgi:predicted dehydrogenase